MKGILGATIDRDEQHVSYWRTAGGEFVQTCIVNPHVSSRN